MAAGTLMREEAIIQWGRTPVIPAIQEADVGGSLVQNQPAGTRDMVLRLKALTALAGELGLVPSTYMEAHNHLQLQETLKPASSLCGQQVHKEYTHMHAGGHSYPENKKPLKKCATVLS